MNFFKRRFVSELVLATFLAFLGVVVINYFNGFSLPFLGDFSRATASYLPAVIVSFILGMRNWLIEEKRPLFPKNFFLTIVLYLPWALIQQTMIIVWVYRPIIFATDNPLFAALAGGLVFGAFHLPGRKFFLCTALGELFFLFQFNRAPSLAAMAIGHAVTGVSLYYLFANKDILSLKLADLKKGLGK